MLGKETWFFPDGVLHPAGDVEPKEHESLIADFFISGRILGCE